MSVGTYKTPLTKDILVGLRLSHFLIKNLRDLVQILGLKSLLNPALVQHLHNKSGYRLACLSALALESAIVQKQHFVLLGNSGILRTRVPCAGTEGINQGCFPPRKVT